MKKTNTNEILATLRDEHVLTDVTPKGEIVGKYPLKKITKGEVKALRKTNIPVFIYKNTSENGTEYWFAIVPDSFSITSRSWCQHSCAKCDILGTVEGKACLSYKSCQESLLIEDYDYISEACVAIHTHGVNRSSTHSLKLIRCEMFKRDENCHEQKKISVRERKALLIGLAQHLDDSIETIADLQKYEDKNLMNRL